MQQHASRQLTSAEVLEEAVDNKCTIGHRRFDDCATFTVSCAPDLNRLFAHAKELESVLSDDPSLMCGEQLGGIRRQSREQAL